MYASSAYNLGPYLDLISNGPAAGLVSAQEMPSLITSSHLLLSGSSLYLLNP